MNVEVSQKLWSLGELGRCFHHHVILIQPCVHGGHLALSKGVIEGVVDQLGGDAKSRGGFSIILEHRLHPVILLIAVHVRNDGDVSQSFQHAGSKIGQVLQAVGAHGELVLRIALSSPDTYILRCLQVKCRPRYSRQLRPQPLDDVIRGNLPLRQRL